MRIEEVRLPASDLAALRPFYAEVVGLDLAADTPDKFTVRAGATRLTFFAAAGEVAPQHFAFTIPRNQLAAAKEWLRGRAALLTQDGQDEFASASWNAQQVYFRDPAGNILELIARQTLAIDAAGLFDASKIVSVSEVGLTTADVPGMVAALGSTFGLTPYFEASDTFTAVGDHEGLLIVVRAGRHWFPTTTPAVAMAVAATLGGVGAGEVREAGWVVRGG